MYAHIQDSSILEYPLTDTQIQERFPELTTPFVTADLPTEYVEVILDPAFSANPNLYYYTEVNPQPSGLNPKIWYRQFDVRPLTEEELAANKALEDSIKNSRL